MTRQRKAIARASLSQGQLLASLAPKLQRVKLTNGSAVPSAISTREQTLAPRDICPTKSGSGSLTTRRRAKHCRKSDAESEPDPGFAQDATHNPTAPEVILGRYIRDSADSYDAVAQARGATYFSMSNWGGVSADIGGASMWSINQAFLDQQIMQGKSFLFTTDPASAPPGSFTSQEYNYLLSKGYNISPDIGGMYRATK